MTDFTFQRLGKSGKTKVSATDAAGRPFAVRVDLLDPEDQVKALDRIGKKLPTLDRERIAELFDEEAARSEPSSDTLAERLLTHVQQPDRMELFHSPEREAFAFVRVSGGDDGSPALWETMRIRGSNFRLWLGREAYIGLGKVPSAETLASVIGALSGAALFASEERCVFVRVGELEDEHGETEVWLDLANDAHEFVRTTSAGWTIVPAREAPIRFVRARGMLALPSPVRGGSVAELRVFVNVTDEQWPLLVGFLLLTLRPRGPYAILLVNGEQGSAKSTAALFIRLLVDPNEAGNRRPPKDPQSLSIAARNGWVLSYDNMSAIPPWLADDLCALVTGAGFATRELYSDSEETIFVGARPVILNGIPDLGDRPDIADRGVHLVLARISDENRREEHELFEAFEVSRPRILGALLDAVVCALARHASVRLKLKPRLADFARWVEAGAPALGLKEGEFLARYFENRDGARAVALESSVFGLAVREWIDRLGSWSGSAKELLAAVSTHENKQLEGWPKSARKVAADLRRLAPCFRSVGILFEMGERDPSSRRATIYLRKLPAQSSASSDPARAAERPEDPEHRAEGDAA